MRRLLILPLLALWALIAAVPASADPTAVTVAPAPASITSAQTFTLDVSLSQPTVSATQAIADAPLQLDATAGFQITSVKLADTTGIAPSGAPSLPGTTWNATATLAADATEQFTVTLLAPSGHQGPSAPLTVSVGGQTDPGDGTPLPASTGVATAVEVVTTGLQVTTDPVPVFPTTSGAATVTVQNLSDRAWTEPVVVELALPAGVTIGNAATGLSGTTWTVPDPGPHSPATLTLTLDVATGTAAGSLPIKATEPSSDPAESPITVAPIPELSIEPMTGPLVVDGPSDVVVVTLLNKSAQPTGQFTSTVTLPSGLELVSGQASGSNAFDLGTKTWTVALAPGASTVLQLRIRATAVPAVGLVVTPQAFGITPKSLSVAVNPKPTAPVPVVSFTGSDTPLFPGDTVAVKVFLTNAGDGTLAARDVELGLGGRLAFHGDLPGDVSASGVWSAPALGAGESRSIDLVLEVSTAAAPGATSLVASPAGGQAKSFAVSVAQAPQVSFALPDTLVEGGDPDVLVVTVTNVATVATVPLSLSVAVPVGLQLVKAVPGLSGGLWSIGALQPGAGATLRLTLKATGPSDQNVDVQLDHYDATVRHASISVDPKVVVPKPVVSLGTSPLTLFPGDSVVRTVSVTNTSATTWPANSKVTFTSGAGIALSSTSAELTGLTWTVPVAVNSGAARTLPLTLTVAAGTPVGSASVTATPAGGSAASLAVNVAPVPQVSITPLDAPLVNGGADDVLVLTVTNGANIPTALLALSVKLPAGLELVRAAPALANDLWAVGALPASSSAVLKLTVRGTATGSQTVGAQLNRYGGALVTQAVSVVAKPAVVEPDPDPPVVTPPVVTPPASAPTPPVVPPVTADPTPAPATLSVDLADPSRKGLAYTYRGEVKYQGAALSRAACKGSRIELVLWKLKGTKTTGRPARVDVALSYLSGHCLFGTRYSFFKRVRGKHYRVDFRVTTKVALPVAGGASRKPAPVTVSDAITVGKSA